MTARTASLVKWRADRSTHKRKSIVDGARREFLKNGFGGASVDAVAEAAAVAKMTVYRHFKNKQALFEGVIGELCERIVGADVTLDPNLPVREALAKFAWMTIETVYNPDTVELQRIVVAEIKRFPELGRLFYKTGPEVCVKALERYLIANRSNSDLHFTNARFAAEEFIELLRGYTHLRVLLGMEKTPSRSVMARRVAAAVNHVLRSNVGAGATEKVYKRAS